MEDKRVRMMEYQRSIMTGALIGLALALVFVAGFFFRDLVDMPSARASLVSDPDEAGYPLLDEVQHLLDRVYLHEQPPYITRQYAAIRGMLSSLGDSRTYFIEPPVAQSEADVFAGTYGGIGVQLIRSETGRFVLFPFPGEPADEAGIDDGDVLHTINGTLIETTMQQDIVDQMMRGEVKEGNGVEITVIKAESGEEYSVFIEFAVINVPSIVWRVTAEDERIGYVQIIRFTNRTPGELDTALNELNAAGVEAYILDLRNNGGGLLQESIAVASAFLDGGPIMHERTRSGETTSIGETGGAGLEYPLVVLVNRFTASASELVAGAIQDRGRGILIGQATFGKGTVQQILPLSDGSSVHITSSEWLTPNRNLLEGQGLTPDIAMIPDESGRDIEFGEAVRYLQLLLLELESEAG